MNVISLIYHDVVDPGREATSGRQGEGPDRYKLTTDRFRDHLARLAAIGPDRRRLWSDTGGSEGSVLLTFDDGGASAAGIIAPLLEAQGWKGHFFIVSDLVGTPGFVTRDQIRSLAAAGHGIGSHSASHPDRFASLTDGEQREEWRRSLQALGEILGRPVTVASVPGGYFDGRVAGNAAACGVEALFTSEPRSRPWTVQGCRVFGRYSVTRSTTAESVASLVGGSGAARTRQRMLWELKKAGKRVGGRWYTAARRNWMRGMDGKGR